MLKIHTIATLCLGLITFAACGTTRNTYNSQSSAQALSDLDEEDVVAGHGLAGLGDRSTQLQIR